MEPKVVKEYKVAPRRVRKVKVKPEISPSPVTKSSERLIQAANILGHFCKDHFELSPLNLDTENYSIAIHTPQGSYDLVEILAATLNCLDN